MVTEPLIHYIKESLKLNKTKEEIKSILMLNHWKDEDIEEAFVLIEKPQKIEEEGTINTINNPKDNLEGKSKSDILTNNNISDPRIVITSIDENDPAQEERVVNSQINTLASQGSVEESKINPVNASVMNQEEIKDLDSKEDVSVTISAPEEIKTNHKKSSRGQLIVLAVLLVLISIGSFVAFMYFSNNNPFSQASYYTEENFLSKVVINIDKVKSVKYHLSGSIAITPRDEGAKPFVYSKIEEIREKKIKHENDLQRIEDVRDIISILRSSYYENDIFPSSLEKSLLSKYNYGSDFSIKDPTTNENYDYKVSEDKQNYSLTVQFETEEVVKSFPKERYGTINNKKVTFSNDSDYSDFWYYGSVREPFLQEISNYFANIPPRFNTVVDFSIYSKINKEGTPDWDMNFNNETDLGDLIYKINFDSIKKGLNYYFRINNFPSMLEMNIDKDQWIRISPDDEDLDDQIASKIKEMENNFKNPQSNEADREVIELMEKSFLIANEFNIIKFKNTPQEEEINGEKLIRYDLGLRKEAITPFFRKLKEEIKKTDTYKENEYQLEDDQEFFEYLESDEFSESFDYLDQYLTLSMWINNQGIPVIIENKIKVIPSDEIESYRDKQLLITFKSVLSDINKDIDINIPKESKSLAKVMYGDDYVKPSDDYNSKDYNSKDYRLMAEMIQMRSAAELYKINNNSLDYANINTLDGEDCSDCIAIMEEILLIDPQAKFRLSDNNKQWCLIATLSNQSNYCVDYMGYADTLKQSGCTGQKFSCK